MKKNLLIAAAILGMLSPAFAQYQPTGADGITASPRVREQLDARKAAPANVAATIAAPKVTAGCCAAKISASPRVQALSGKNAASCCGNSVCVVACAK